MVAGEPSGDLLAGLMLDAVKFNWPNGYWFGIGGPQMIQRGFVAWWPQHLLAVRGYIEVLPRLWKLLAIRRALRKRLLASPPDVFVGMDAPDFNFALEERLRRAGIPVIHYVSPSFWAWRAHKVAQLKRSADLVLCIFPFEPALLKERGVEAVFVGHPLASVIPIEPDRQVARAALGLKPDDTVVNLISKRRVGVKFVVPAIPGLQLAIEAAARDSGLGDRLRVVAGQSHAVLAACDVTLIASGTATLEAALFKRPMVIAYHMPWLSWIIMRGKNLQPWVGLPNILCRETVVPEFLQDDATPEALAAAALHWLDHPEKVSALEQRFTTLHHTLRQDSARLAVDAIKKIVHR